MHRAPSPGRVDSQVRKSQFGSSLYPTRTIVMVLVVPLTNYPFELMLSYGLHQLH